MFCLGAVFLFSIRGFAVEIVKPEAPKAPALILPPGVIAAAPSELVLPDGTPAPSAAAEPLVLPAARTLSPEEMSPQKLPSRSELSRLAASLTAKDAAETSPSGSAFDGSHAPSAGAWEATWLPRRYFSQGPLAPELPVVAATTQALFARLLPRFFRPLTVTSFYADQSWHSWSPQRGHVIDIYPGRPDHEGKVLAAAGAGETKVAQKIFQLVTYAHEFAHALFDAAVGYQGEPMGDHTAYHALTEGFAIGLQQMFANRLVAQAPALEIPPNDALDLSAEHSARLKWLEGKQTTDAEGYLAWRKAFEASREEGLQDLLSALSSHRLLQTSRADPVYQLTLGNPALLSAYLGKDQRNPLRLGLEAYGRIAHDGQPVSQEERLAAAAAVAQAGPEGWERVFRRTLFRAIRVESNYGPQWAVPDWLAASPSVQPAFALAQLSPEAGLALRKLLAETAKSQDRLADLFEGAAPGERRDAILYGAQLLPWDEASLKSWNEAVGRFVTAGASGVQP